MVKRKNKITIKKRKNKKEQSGKITFKKKTRKNKSQRKYKGGKSPVNLPPSISPSPQRFNPNEWRWNPDTGGWMRISQGPRYNIIEEVRNNNIDGVNHALNNRDEFNATINTIVLPERITPLMIAVQNQNRDMVIHLLANNADREATDINGHTALDMSISANNDEISNILRNFTPTRVVSPFSAFSNTTRNRQ